MKIIILLVVIALISLWLLVRELDKDIREQNDIIIIFCEIVLFVCLMFFLADIVIEIINKIHSTIAMIG